MTQELRKFPIEDGQCLSNLVELVYRTNIKALSKALEATSYPSYAYSASRCKSLAERLCVAVKEVGLTLPLDMMAVK